MTKIVMDVRDVVPQLPADPDAAQRLFHEGRDGTRLVSLAIAGARTRPADR
jgi:hypothetical protein